MTRRLENVMALSSGLSLGGVTHREVAPALIRLEYSALPGPETPLPHGLQPTSLLQSATGSDVVSDLLQHRHGEPARTVADSLAFVRAIAVAVPTDAEDERLVDALMARQAASVATRPLRRRVDRGE